MSLGKKLVHATQKEAVMKSPLPQRAEATLPHGKNGEVRASVQVADHDRFSKMVERVKVEVSGNTSTGDAAKVAQKFADRASYLTERLRPVESNESSTVVRSTPETMSGKGGPYFEATVKETEVTLERFQSQKGGGRNRVPFCVTDDVLGRIVDDAAGALGGK